MYTQVTDCFITKKTREIKSDNANVLTKAL